MATTEYAPGQYEINLRHVEDPLAAADHCALLRHIVQRVAARHGLEATFMAKPHLEQTGNGCRATGGEGVGRHVLTTSVLLIDGSFFEAVGDAGGHDLRRCEHALDDRLLGGNGVDRHQAD